MFFRDQFINLSAIVYFKFMIFIDNVYFLANDVTPWVLKFQSCLRLSEITRKFLTHILEMII